MIERLSFNAQNGNSSSRDRRDVPGKLPSGAGDLASGPPSSRHLTAWGPLLGVLLSVGLNVLAGFGYVRFNEYSGFTDHFNTIGVVFVLLLLCWPVSALTYRLFRRTLSSADRALIYFCLMLATVIPTMGFLGYLLPIISGVRYYATAENHWSTLLGDHLQPWLLTTPGTGIRWFYESLPPGASVPWSSWISPLLFWGVFFLTLSLVSLALMVLLRRQWQEHEHLAYPLTMLPLELIGAAPRRDRPLTRNPLFWIGFGLAFGLAFYNAATVILSKADLLTLRQSPFRLGVPMFRQTVSANFSLDPLVLGLSYFVTVDVLASVWVFHWLAACVTGIMNILGFSQTGGAPHAAGNAYLALQQTGSLFFLAGAALWTARSHLAATWRGAVSDADEIAPYRLAWVVVIVGFAVLWYLLALTGLAALLAGLVLVLGFGLFLGTTLLLAQTGIGRLRAPHSAPGLVAQLVGTARLSASQIAALGLTFIWGGDLQLFAMGTSAHGLQAFHEAGADRPRWAGPLAVLALVAALAAGMWAYLAFGYRYGALGGYGWYFKGSPVLVWTWTTAQLRGGTPATRGGVPMVLLGAALAFAVDTLHKRYFWWPLHPAGLAISQINTVVIDWFSMFLAWLIKVAVLHYGGPKAFRASIPAFLGLIAGACTGVSLSFLVRMLTA